MAKYTELQAFLPFVKVDLALQKMINSFWMSRRCEVRNEPTAGWVKLCFSSRSSSVYILLHGINIKVLLLFAFSGFRPLYVEHIS